MNRHGRLGLQRQNSIAERVDMVPEFGKRGRFAALVMIHVLATMIYPTCTMAVYAPRDRASLLRHGGGGPRATLGRAVRIDGLRGKQRVGRKT